MRDQKLPSHIQSLPKPFCFIEHFLCARQWSYNTKQESPSLLLSCGRENGLYLRYLTGYDVQERSTDSRIRALTQSLKWIYQWPPKRYVSVNSLPGNLQMWPDSENGSLQIELRINSAVENLRSSGIIKVYLTAVTSVPYKRKAEGDLTQTEEEKR